MEKTFILLRSNKQVGPYTLNQMSQMNLKSDDLVYMENNVAGWMYASEIDVLKPYISTAKATSKIAEQEVKAEPVKITQPEAVKTTHSEPVKISQTQAVTITQPEPVKITQPEPVKISQVAPPVEAPQKETLIVSQHELPSPEETVIQAERKVISPVQKQIAVSLPAEVKPPVIVEKPFVPESIPEPQKHISEPPLAIKNITEPPLIFKNISEPKFVIKEKAKETSPKPLSIKGALVMEAAVPVASPVISNPPESNGEYLGWITSNKRKKRTTSLNKKGILIGAASLMVLALGFVLVKSFDGNQESKTQIASETVSRQSPQENEGKASLQANLNKGETSAPPPSTTSNTPAPSSVVLIDEKATPEPSVEVAEKKVQPDAQIDKEREKINKIVEPRKQIAAIPLAPTPVTTINATTKTIAPKSLLEQITLKSTSIDNGGEQGVYGLNVSLQNNSDKVLKMVAVNVIYSNDAGAVINKQTLYFSNIQPGQAISRAASSHKLAGKASCTLGLVSSEGKIYYEN